MTREGKEIKCNSWQNHAPGKLLGPGEDEPAAEKNIWLRIFVLPQIIGWQNGSMPWSGQSRGVVHAFSSPPWRRQSCGSQHCHRLMLRQQHCLSQMAGMSQLHANKIARRALEKKNILLFVFHLFQKLPFVAQKSWEHSVTIATFLQLLLSLSNLWFSSQ